MSGKSRFLLPEVALLGPSAEGPPVAVRVSGWTLDGPTMGTLVQAMAATESLSAIEFWNAGLCDASLAVLVAALPALQLRRVEIASNVPPEGSQLTGGALAALLRPVPSAEFEDEPEVPSPVASLSLRRCGLDDAALQPLAAALRSNAGLVRLALDGNRIADAGAGMLAEALRRNRTLRSLSLADNAVGDRGLASLAAALTASELSHAELVFRRKTLSQHYSTTANDRPSSSRSTAQRGGTPSGGRGKGKGDKKGGKGGKGKGKGEAVADAPAAVNPLLESVSTLDDGRIVLGGNFAVAHLNLSRNRLTAAAATTLRGVLEHQAAAADGAGIQRLAVAGNPGAGLACLGFDAVAVRKE